jgi:hypothetical protein
MTPERGEDESSRTKPVARGEGTTGGGVFSNPMPGQCIFCGKQFENNEELEKHEKEVH